jgi:hypothetical protein
MTFKTNLFLSLTTILLVISFHLNGQLTYHSETTALPVSTSNMNGESVALSLYKTLTGGIEQCDDCRIVVNLYEGTIKTHIDGTNDIIWQVRPNTSATLEMKFLSGKWKTLRMKFGDRTIKAQFRTGTPNQKIHEISQINFEDDGTPREYFDEFHQPIPISLANFPEVRAHLTLPTNPGQILQGKTFAGLDANAPAGQKGLQVRRITLPTKDDKTRPLAVVLRDRNQLKFRSTSLEPDTGCADYVVLKGATAFTFDRLDYVIETGEINAESSGVNLPYSEGCITAGKTILKFAEGNAAYGLLKLSAGPGGSNSLIKGTQGSVSAILGNGSSLVLAEVGDAQLFVEAAKGSTVTLNQTVTEFSGAFTRLSTAAVSSANLTVTKAHVPLAGPSYVQLNGGSVVASFSGAWETDKTPRLTGSFKQFSAPIESGVLVLTGDYRLPLGKGEIDASETTFSNAQLPVLNGKINSFRTQIVPGTSLQFPNGKTVNVIAPASVTSAPPDAMTLVANENFPLGTYQLSVPFSTLNYQATPHVHLVNGMARASLVAKQAATLRWSAVSIDGDQVGSYNHAEELPADEYRLVSNFTDGRIKAVVPQRGMIVNTVPTKSDAEIAFYDTGKINSATLSRDTFIGPVPLRGNTAVLIYRTEIRVKSGTLSKPFTIDGKEYAAGTTVTIPWIKFVPALVLQLADADTVLKHLQTGVNDQMISLLDAQPEKPDCLWASPKSANGLQSVRLPRRIDSNAFVYASSWTAPKMLRNASPLPACDCQVTLEPRISLTVVDKVLYANPQPLMGNVKFSCSACPWYSTGMYSDYVRGVWADTFNRALSSEKALVDALQALVEQRANGWASNAPNTLPDAEKGTFFFKEVSIRDAGVEILFGYQVL